MSDKSEGPGWWIASDGKWYPPELHPSVREESATDAVHAGPRRGPRRRWDDDPVARPPTSGPQFPDLFQKALQGSHLADNVSVKYDGEERRTGNQRVDGRSRRSAPPRRPSTAGPRRSSGVVGATIGAPVSKKRWRKGR